MSDTLIDVTARRAVLGPTAAPAMATEVQLLEAVRALSLKVDALGAQVAYLHDRARAVEELKDELVPLARDAMAGLQSELQSIEHEFNSDEVVYLLRQLLRSTPRFIWLLERLDSVSALIEELEPLAREMLRAGIDGLEEAERRGFFRIARGAFALLSRIASHYTQQDIDALSENLIHILDTVKNFTQPQVLAAANRALGALEPEAAPASAPPRMSLWKLWRATREPEIQHALGMAIELLRRMGRRAAATPAQLALPPAAAERTQDNTDEHER